MDIVTLGAALNGSKKYTDQVGQSLESNLSSKANTSDVNTATANLQTQIDEIAQAAGTGSADTEVAQARVGVDGTTYNTLKARLDDENSGLKENLSDINTELQKWELFNIFKEIDQTKKRSSESVGITFDWDVNFNVCRVSGTATGTGGYNFYFDRTNTPDLIENGKRYYIKFNSTDANIRIQFLFYLADDTEKTIWVSNNTELVIPENVKGMIIRIRVLSGITVDGEISNIAMYSGKDNKALTEEINLHEEEINKSKTSVDGESYNSVSEHINAFETETRKIKADFENIGYKDIFKEIDITKRKSSTQVGISFRWNSSFGTCEVTGTSTGTGGYNYYNNQNELPEEIVAGSTYYVKYNSTDEGIRIQFVYYYENKNSTNIWVSKDETVKIPVDCIGITIRIRVVSGTTVNGTITNIGMYESKSVKELTEDSIKNSGLISVINDETEELASQVIKKISVPKKAGVSGQVLSVDENGNTVWASPSAQSKDTISEVLDEMIRSGEYADYFSTVPDESLGIEKLTSSVKNALLNQFVIPEMFGAHQEYEDNSDYIQNAMNYCAENKVALYIPPKKYNIKNGLICNCELIMDGTFIYSGKNVALTIGDGSFSTFYTHYKINVEGLSDNNYENTQSIGIKMINLCSCFVELTNIKYFKQGVQIIGDSKGFIYNKITIGTIQNCQHGIYISLINSGWVTDNLFEGGRIWNSSVSPVKSDSIGLYIDSVSGNYNFSNNCFIKPCLEENHTAIKINGGRSISIISARTENCVYALSLDGSAKDNLVKIGFGISDVEICENYTGNNNACITIQDEISLFATK